MKTNQTQHHPSVRHECERARLATSSVAAIDICSCGIMQLHLGVITLRLAPCAIFELLATLGEAVAEQAAREARESSASALIPIVSGKRGEA